MKALRIKHYGYIVATGLLLVFCALSIVGGLKGAQAEVGEVAITYPAPDQKVFQGNQTIKGTAPALKKLSVFDGTKKIGETTAGVDGKWQINWPKVKPGQHNLKAYLVEGIVYDSNPLSPTSVKGSNLNDGQTATSFEAGISSPEAVVYDSVGNKSFVLNRINHSISVFNMANNSLSDTIKYATTEALVPTDEDKSPCRCTNFSYVYDQQNRRLYVLDLERIYVINTQDNSVVRTTPVSLAGQDNFDYYNPADYRLYLDPAASYLYLYVANGNDDKLIQRYSTDTGQKDESWVHSGRAIVGISGGDVYFVNRTNNSETASAKSYLYKYSSSNQQTSVVDLSSLCYNPSWYLSVNLAVATDQNTIYTSCEGDSSGHQKLLGINASSGQITNLNLPIDASYTWLTKGNLVANKLAFLGATQTYHSGDNFTYTAAIKGFNTETNSFQQDIELDESQYFGSDLYLGAATSLLAKSFVVSPDGWFSFMSYKAGTVYIFVANTDSNQVQHTYQKNGVAELQFDGVRNSAYLGNNKVGFLPDLERNSIKVIDTSSGGVSTIQHGAGSGIQLYSSKLANRLFATSEVIRFNSESFGPLSGRITVSNLQTGEYQQTINLESVGYIAGAVMDANEQYLYVASISLVDPSNITVRKINTQTLNVERTYSPIDIGNQIPYLRMKLTNNELMLSSYTATVKLLNIANDTQRTLTLDSVATSATSFMGLITADPQGSKIAAYNAQASSSSGRHKISIIDRNSLEVSATVDLGSNDSSVVSSLGFTNDGKLLVGYYSLTGGNLKIHNLDGTVHVQAAGSNFPSGQRCYIANIHSVPSEEAYIFTDSYCLPVGGDGYGDVSRYLEVYDAQNLNKIQTIKQAEAGAYDSSNYSSLLAVYSLSKNSTYPEVITANQTVNVVADGIEITSPASNAELAKGEHTIKGTAPPGQTVTVTVNGSSIGTATSDEYGLWEKKYTFAAGNHDIKAAYQQPGYAKAYLTRLSFATTQSYYTSGVNLLDGSVEDDISPPAGMAPIASFLSEDGSKLYIFNLALGEGGLTLEIYNTENNDPPTTVNLDIANEGDGDGDIDLLATPVISEDGETAYMLLQGTDYNAQFTAISTVSGQVEDRIDLGQECDSLSDIFGATPIVAEDLNMAYLFCRSGMAFAVDLSIGTATSLDIPEDSFVAAYQYDATSSTLYMLAGNDDASDVFVLAYNLESSTVNWTTGLDNYPTVYPFSMLLSPDGSELRVVATDAQDASNLTTISVPGISTSDGTITDHTFNKEENFGEDNIPMGNQMLVNMDQSTNGENIYLSFFNVNTLQSYDIANVSMVATYNKAENKITSTFKGTNEDVYLRTSPGKFIKASPAREDSDTVSVTVSGATVPGATCNPATDAACKPPTCTSNCGEPKLPPIECNIRTACPISGEVKKEIENKVKAITKTAQQDNAQVPPAIQSVSQVQVFSANILAAIKRFVASVPMPLISIFPYLLLALLLSLIAYYLYQTQVQLRREDRLRAIFEKQKVLSEEKRNFLELTSHYLRTPLTYIKAGSEMLLRNKQNEATASELTQSVEHLGLFIESLVEEASASNHVEPAEMPKQRTWSPLVAKSFWIPAAGFATALGLFYLIFGVIGGVNFGPARYVTQLLLVFVVLQLFYGMFKNHQRITDEEALFTKTINNETSLDHTRSKLIHDAGEQLKTRTAHLTSALNKLQSADTSKAIMQQGIDRLSELSQAFMLVSQLESDVLAGKVEPVSVRAIAADIIQPMAEKLRAKKVKVEVSGFDQDITLTTNKPLAELTLKSLLENALDASKEGSSLVVKCLHKEGRVAFQVIDHGEGIQKDKIERLFKPFVRVGPVTTFNREGIGLSLYLDRLIMHSLGGEVEIASRFKHGTTATVTFKQKQTA